MRVFLTGGTGFVGSHLLNHYLENNNEVTALKRSNDSKTKIFLKKEPKWILGSLNNIKRKHLINHDLLVHLAAHSAQPPYDNLHNCILNNVLNPIKLFENAFNAGIRRFIVAGSCFEYGLSANAYDKIPPNAPLFPVDTYPASKAMASIAFIQWAIEKKVSMSIQRLFYVYGEGESQLRFYPSLKNAALKGSNFRISKGEQIRDISEVRNSIANLYNESKRIISSKSFDVRINNIGSGNALSIKDFAIKLWSSLNAKGKLEVGVLNYRDKEIMRYVPNLEKVHIIHHFK